MQSATETATTYPKTILAARTCQFQAYAMRVAEPTRTLTIGPARRYATAVENGTPLRTSLRVNGITAHSHTGSSRPRLAATKIPRIFRSGRSLTTISRGTNTSNNPPSSDPSITNGNASKIMLTKESPIAVPGGVPCIASNSATASSRKSAAGEGPKRNAPPNRDFVSKRLLVASLRGKSG